MNLSNPAFRRAVTIFLGIFSLAVGLAFACHSRSQNKAPIETSPSKQSVLGNFVHATGTVILASATSGFSIEIPQGSHVYVRAHKNVIIGDDAVAGMMEGYYIDFGADDSVECQPHSVGLNIESYEIPKSSGTSSIHEFVAVNLFYTHRGFEPDVVREMVFHGQPAIYFERNGSDKLCDVSEYWYYLFRQGRVYSIGGSKPIGDQVTECAISSWCMVLTRSESIAKAAIETIKFSDESNSRPR